MLVDMEQGYIKPAVSGGDGICNTESV
jgi:hypothetical protein